MNWTKTAEQKPPKDKPVLAYNVTQVGHKRFQVVDGRAVITNTAFKYWILLEPPADRVKPPTQLTAPQEPKQPSLEELMQRLK